MWPFVDHLNQDLCTPSYNTPSYNTPSYNTPIKLPLTLLITLLCRFVDLSSSDLSVEDCVNAIVERGIHVLVNMNGYTRGSRNEIFAARPAPIQVRGDTRNTMRPLKRRDGHVDRPTSRHPLIYRDATSHFKISFSYC